MAGGIDIETGFADSFPLPRSDAAFFFRHTRDDATQDLALNLDRLIPFGRVSWPFQTTLATL